MTNIETCGTFVLPTTTGEVILSIVFGLLYFVLLSAVIIGTIRLNKDSPTRGSGKMQVSLIANVILSCAYIFKGLFFFLAMAGHFCTILLLLHLAFYTCLFSGILFILFKSFQSLRISFVRRGGSVLLRVQQISFFVVGGLLVLTLVCFVLMHYDKNNGPKATAYAVFMLLVFFGILFLILTQALYLKTYDAKRYSRRRPLYVGLIIYGGINLLTTLSYVIYFKVAGNSNPGTGTMFLVFVLGYLPAAFPALLIIYYIGVYQMKEPIPEKVNIASFLENNPPPQSYSPSKEQKINADQIQNLESSLLGK